MYDNTVKLTGFVGADAERKTTNSQHELTILSLATTASWKDKKGVGYVRRTDWHKLVAWGKLSRYAATLKKGAHISVVGELRYSEFVPKADEKRKNNDQKIRVTEIRITKISKLDRAPKQGTDAATPDPQESPS
jgi:single-strand DNA-binding protein